MNRETDGLFVYEKIDEQIQWKHSSYYTTKGNRKMFCFIDDLQLAKIDRSNCQSLVELIRQHIDSNGLYHPQEFNWQHIDNMTYVVTINSNQSLSKLNRLLKHFHIIEMDMSLEEDLVSIFTKLLNRHILGDFGENQLTLKETTEHPGRISTGKSSTTTTITTTTLTTTTAVDPSSTNIAFKEKYSTQALKRFENLRSILDKIVRSTVELNNRLRDLFQPTNQRIHYVFSMKQLTQLFRNLCISLTPESSIDDILHLWHHECIWLYQAKLIDQIDQQRYQQLYLTIVKKYFTNMINEQQILLDDKQLFSNLQVTESGQLNL